MPSSEIEELAWRTDAAAETHPGLKKPARAVAELQTSIANDAAWIPNDGERHRNGEAISAAVAVSTVNQLISKRMVTRRRMRRSPAGAHLLLHVRTQALNDDLRGPFRRRYPGFDQPADQEAQVVSPPPVLRRLRSRPIDARWRRRDRMVHLWT